MLAQAQLQHRRSGIAIVGIREFRRCVPFCVLRGRVLSFAEVEGKVLTGSNSRQYEVFSGFSAAIARAYCSENSGIRHRCVFLRVRYTAKADSGVSRF